MFEMLSPELFVPVSALANSVLSIAAIVIFTLIMAFLVFLAYFMGARLWPVAAAFLVLYILISLDFPHPTVREALASHPIPPLDIVRMLVGVTPGLISILLLMMQFNRPGGNVHGKSSH